MKCILCGKESDTLSKDNVCSKCQKDYEIAGKDLNTDISIVHTKTAYKGWVPIARIFNVVFSISIMFFGILSGVMLVSNGNIELGAAAIIGGIITGAFILCLIMVFLDVAEDISMRFRNN